MESPQGGDGGAMNLDDDHVVTVLPNQLRIGVRAHETIVDALRRQGYRTRYKCRRGGCGACRATLLEGQITYVAQVSAPVIDGADNDTAPDTQKFLPCRATPKSDVIFELGPRDRLDNVLAGLGGTRPRKTQPHPTPNSTKH
ncbi:2Fe-2S iron-sulfur cluster-binding protein [Rhodococcus jostii]|uniref:2Fe-2S iron-sulfur cluster-binding protein n=1 Tax=Rhodococcus jostii TaxID=132919 RepID=A0ABU4CLN1_RHOJO|nr:2Fe-2S iron-sulfur cluster-binding protein [Rhodococcus jostii]MDV6284471.1 2Fe-2S iron-sulfur cluster-binding protein [Rhodococcus jostii]